MENFYPRLPNRAAEILRPFPCPKCVIFTQNRRGVSACFTYRKKFGYSRWPRRSVPPGGCQHRASSIPHWPWGVSPCFSSFHLVSLTAKILFAGGRFTLFHLVALRPG